MYDHFVREPGHVLQVHCCWFIHSRADARAGAKCHAPDAIDAIRQYVWNMFPSWSDFLQQCSIPAPAPAVPPRVMGTIKTVWPQDTEMLRSLLAGVSWLAGGDED